MDVVLQRLQIVVISSQQKELPLLGCDPMKELSPNVPVTGLVGEVNTIGGCRFILPPGWKPWKPVPEMLLKVLSGVIRDFQMELSCAVE